MNVPTHCELFSLKSDRLFITHSRSPILQWVIPILYPSTSSVCYLTFGTVMSTKLGCFTKKFLTSTKICNLKKENHIYKLYNQCFFLVLWDRGRALRIGKMRNKTRIQWTIHLDWKEVFLRYLNINYKNKWMPVLSTGEIKYIITLHKRISYNFFLWNFGLGNFSGIGKFRGNSDWDWGRISAPNWVKKNTDNRATY